MKKRSEIAAGAAASSDPKPSKSTSVECSDCAHKMPLSRACDTEPPSCPRCGAELTLTDDQLAKVKKLTDPDQKTAQAKANADLALFKNENDVAKATEFIRESVRAGKLFIEDGERAIEALPAVHAQKLKDLGREPATAPATPAAKAAATSLVEQHARKPDPSDVGEMVSYTWGEEMFRFGDFSNCKVGPFVGETRIREGETRAHAIARLQREVDGQAKIARDAKLDDYLKAIVGVKKRIERAS